MCLLHQSGLDNTYNDKSKFYKQSYTYMYASYMYINYVMPGVFSACVLHYILATRMCKFSHACVASCMLAQASKISTLVFMSAVCMSHMYPMRVNLHGTLVSHAWTVKVVGDLYRNYLIIKWMVSITIFVPLILLVLTLVLVKLSFTHTYTHTNSHT